MKKSLLNKIFLPVIITVVILVSIILIWPVFKMASHNLVFGTFFLFLIMLTMIRPKINPRYKNIEAAIIGMLILLVLLFLRIWGQNIKI